MNKKINFIFLLLLALFIILNPLYSYNNDPYVYEGIEKQDTETDDYNKMKIKKSLENLISEFGYKKEEYAIIVIIEEQKLYLIKNYNIEKMYPVSTSKYGVGNQYGSNKTPLGVHKIYSKIGEGLPIGTIFESRINTGRIAQIYSDAEYDNDEDLITSRILRLMGLEQGVNRGNNVDSFDRYIYIHGTPEEGLIGKPASHGCIRMKNTDVIELFDIVRENTLVDILN